MVLNYENNLVFSGSEDGSVAFMTLIDQDKRQKMISIPPVNHASEVLVQGKLRDQLLQEIKVKSIELEERKAEASTKLELRKKNFNQQMQELKNLMQSEEERGGERMTIMKQTNEEK